MGKRILVTGGVGFIGTHLCNLLVSSQDLIEEVRVLDLRSPVTPIKGVDYFRGDIRKNSDLEKALDGIDVVMHLAALVSIGVCQENPSESYETNTIGTVNILEILRKKSKKPKLIFSSTSAVYGNPDPESLPLSEHYPTTKLESFYAAQKLASENAIQLFHKSFQVPALIFRFFNVYGPGQDPFSPYSGVISIFNQRLKKNQPLRLNGGGTQTRDFISVHDIVSACKKAIELPDRDCQSQVMNLGFGRGVSIKELAELMRKVSGCNVPLVDAPWRDGDVRDSLAKINLSQEVLRWYPKITLEEGLKELNSNSSYF